MKFRSKPVVIEARQFDGTVNSAVELVNWAGQKSGIEYVRSETPPHYCVVFVRSMQGRFGAVKGDWIIKSGSGLSLCRSGEFEKKFERLEE